MKPDTTTYQGRRLNSTISVTVDGKELSPAKSLKIRSHSPDGFNWSYYGSGPAQLALAILLDFTDDADLSERLYQDFKRELVAGWGHEWQITGQEINAWLNLDRI